MTVPKSPAVQLKLEQLRNCSIAFLPLLLFAPFVLPGVLSGKKELGGRRRLSKARCGISFLPAFFPSCAAHPTFSIAKVGGLAR
jgi:hypothetical protein